jgi:hypothetical protein
MGGLLCSDHAQPTHEITERPPIGQVLVPASADQAFDIGFHQDLQHGFRHRSQDIPLATFLQQFR